MLRWWYWFSRSQSAVHLRLCQCVRWVKRWRGNKSWVKAGWSNWDDGKKRRWKMGLAAKWSCKWTLKCLSVLFYYNPITKPGKEPILSRKTHTGAFSLSHRSDWSKPVPRLFMSQHKPKSPPTSAQIINRGGNCVYFCVSWPLKCCRWKKCLHLLPLHRFSPFFKLNYIYRAPIYNNSHLMKIPPHFFFCLKRKHKHKQTVDKKFDKILTDTNTLMMSECKI